MKTNYPDYNAINWISTIEKYAKRAEKYPLCKCRGIWITRNEITTIENLHDKVLERLAFTLLCLAKFNNFKNPQNNNWVNYSNGEVYKMACINTTAYLKDLKYSQLHELQLINFAKKINNLNILCSFLLFCFFPFPIMIQSGCQKQCHPAPFLTPGSNPIHTAYSCGAPFSFRYNS